MKGVILALSLCFQLIYGGIIGKNMKKAKIPEPPPATEQAKLARFVMFYSGEFNSITYKVIVKSANFCKKRGYIFFYKGTLTSKNEVEVCHLVEHFFTPKSRTSFTTKYSAVFPCVAI